jgi:CRISPR-associated protein Cas2
MVVVEMHVILVYDASEKRDRLALRICRKYLQWIQNSVFEGHLTPAQLRHLSAELATHLYRNEDRVMVYQSPEESPPKREAWGAQREPTDSIL